MVDLGVVESECRAGQKGSGAPRELSQFPIGLIVPQSLISDHERGTQAESDCCGWQPFRGQIESCFHRA